jgi:citrate synthase
VIKLNTHNSHVNESDLLRELTALSESSNTINPELFTKYEVKRGLRDLDGRGVLVGLTEIGEVHSYIVDENELIPVPGRLSYRGIDVADITAGYLKDERYGFEETTYLLLFGKLPNKQELAEFETLLGNHRKLPDNFASDMIFKAPSKDIMNVLARSVLSLYSFDEKPDDTSMQNVLRQCINLIACFPTIAVYGYQAYAHYHGNDSLYIHPPRPDLTTAENILYMLRPDKGYTKLEATLLDLALILHAEHGGGNNSSFTTHLVTSSGTDTYSVIAAALGSLKGPKHGGANIKVVHMFEDMKQNIKDWTNDEEIEDYLMRLLNRQAFDKAGLIYGIGHAVYSVSDPRAIILKNYAGELAKEKGLENEYNFYTKVEELAPKVIGDVRKMYKGVSANVDFYSGFVYSMLNLPMELYTPLFAIARITGWSAHRMEELVNKGKIIRPAYKSVAKRREYVSLDERSLETKDEPSEDID